MEDSFMRSLAQSMLAGDRADCWPGSNEGQWQAGCAVHRGNFRAGLSAVLEEAFPVVRQLVGDEFFAMLAGRFVSAHPPASPILSRYGADFAGFIAGIEALAEYPYIPDVARLEHAIGQAIHAEDHAQLQTPDLVGAQSSSGVDFLVTFHPAVAVIASDYPVVSIWRAHQGDQAVQAMEAWDPETALVVRPHLDVLVRSVPPGIGPFVAALARGDTLGEAIAATMEAAVDCRPDEALAFLVREGALTDLKPLSQE